MAVPISSFLSPASASIPFLMEDKYLRGGYRVVNNQTARDAIPVGARLSGMMVFVVDTAQFFQWTGSVWQELDVTRMVKIGDGLKLDEDQAIVVDEEHLANTFAAVDHNHDEQYAAAEHNHDEQYAATEHSHDEQYAPVDHTHDGFAPADHDHDEDYAAANHNHDEQYAPADHTHEGFASADHNHDEQYAPAEHNHDEQYAPADHTHEGFASINHQHAFASLTEIPKVSAMPGVTISTTEPGPEDGEDGDIWFVVAQ